MVVVKNAIRRVEKNKMGKKVYTSSEDKIIEFATLIGKLELVDFFGLCKILCVPTTVSGDGEDLRDFDEVCSDLIDRFISLGRKQKREIFKLLKQVSFR